MQDLCTRLARPAKLLIILALLAPLTLTAQSGNAVTFNWTPPTAYEDGSSLDPATDIIEYRIYCSGDATVTMIAPGGVNDSYSASYSELPPGDYTCTATAVASNQLESDHTNAVNFTVTRGKPGSPAPLSVDLT